MAKIRNESSTLSPVPCAVLLGGPGAGKGVVSRVLREHMQMEHICTGDIFRRLIADEIHPGPDVKDLVESGQLVEDDIVNGLVEEHLDKLALAPGIVFDGYPRSRSQAQTLDWMLAKRGRRLKRAILIDIPEERLIARARARKICSNKRCQRSYGGSTLPRVTGSCDDCLCPLITRKDDQPEVIGKRLEVLRQYLAPVSHYYLSTGRLHVLRPDEHSRSSDTARSVLQLLQSL